MTPQEVPIGKVSDDDCNFLALSKPNAAGDDELQASSSTGGDSKAAPRADDAQQDWLGRYCALVARRPLSVCCFSIVVLLVLGAIPFAIYQGDTIKIDMSLDAYMVRGNAIGERQASHYAALCGGPCKSWDDLRDSWDRVMQPDDNHEAHLALEGEVVAVYQSLDNGTVLTEGRIRQALHLENQVRALLGAPISSPLTRFFPQYPSEAGMLTGAALTKELKDLASFVADTRNRDRLSKWPSFDRQFSACSLVSTLITARFKGLQEEDPRIWDVYPQMNDMKTADLQLTWFPLQNSFFDEERNDMIGQDTQLLQVVIVIMLLMMTVFTRSFFVAFSGLGLITIACGAAIFLYRVFVTPWFGLLNSLSYFLILGIGCDDVFVLVDTWRHTVELLGHEPEDYPRRLRAMLPRACKAVMITSLTTAAAFFGNAISEIPPLRLFGVFSGFMVLTDFALTMACMPSVLVVQHRWFGKHSCRGRCPAPTPGAGRAADRCLVRRVMPLLFKAAPVVLVVSAALMALALNVATTMRDGAEFDESDMMPPEHNQARAHRAKAAMEDLMPDYVQNFLVFGVLPVDDADLNNPTTWSDVHWDSSWDPRNPAVQKYTVDLCDDLAAKTGLVRSVRACWAQDVRTRMLELRRPFPTTTEADWQEGLAAVLFGLQPRRGGYWAQIVIMTQVDSDATIKELRGAFDEWEAYMERWGDEARRRGVPEGFQTSPHWHGMSTIETMASGMLKAVAISMSFVVIMLVVLMRNLVVVSFVVGHLLLICLCLISFMVMEGRRLGILESICITLLVGLAVDYLVHVGAAYLEESREKSRQQRSLLAVAHLGPSVFAGACTTLTASIFLCVAQNRFFRGIGVFILTTMLLAVLATLGPFVASLCLFGPEGDSGELRCPRRCRRRHTTATETLPPPPPARASAVLDELPMKPSGRRVRLATAIISAVLLAAGAACCLGLRIEAAKEEPQEPCPEITELSFTFEAFEVPKDRDSYRCRGFEGLPQHCTYYVTAAEPIVDPAAAHVVHHMVIFATQRQQPSCPFTCFDMPEATAVDAAWAVGGGALAWPEGMALAFGGSHQALQMHYSNWRGEEGLVDGRSGLRFKLSLKEPEKVVTVLNVGLHPMGTLVIPAGQPAVGFYSDCQVPLGAEATVQAYGVHAHKLGRSITTEIWRLNADGRTRPRSPRCLRSSRWWLVHGWRRGQLAILRLQLPDRCDVRARAGAAPAPRRHRADHLPVQHDASQPGRLGRMGQRRRDVHDVLVRLPQARRLRQRLLEHPGPAGALTVRARGCGGVPRIVPRATAFALLAPGLH